MIIIGADHAGFELKEKLIEYLKNKNLSYIDISDHEIDLEDDYVDVAELICKEVLKSKDNFGIAICGTGIGISIACNKIKGIRAALGYNKEVSRLAKEHNNANVLCFGGRFYNSAYDIIDCLEEYMNANFEGERHLRRIEKIEKLEEKFGDKKW